MEEVKVLLIDKEYLGKDSLRMSGFLTREIALPGTYRKAREDIASNKFDIILLDPSQQRYFTGYSECESGSPRKNAQEKPHEDLWQITQIHSPRSVLLSTENRFTAKGYIYADLIKLAEGQTNLFEKMSKEKKQEMTVRVRRLQALESKVDSLFSQRKINIDALSPSERQRYYTARTLETITPAKALIKVYFGFDFYAAMSLIQEAFYEGRVSDEAVTEKFKERYEGKVII